MLKYVAGLPTRTKLLAILVSLLVPIAMLFYFDVAQSLSTIKTAGREDKGTHWIKPMISVARNVAEHRDHYVAVAAGHNDERAELEEHAGRVQEAVKELDTLVAEDFGGMAVISNWSAIRGDVLALVSGGTPPADVVGAHNEVTEKTLKAVANVATESGLSLDPDADSYAMVDAAIMQIPTGLQALALARRDFDDISTGDDSAAKRVALGEKIGVADTRLHSAMQAFTESYATAAPDDKVLPEKAKAVQEKLEQVLPALRAGSSGQKLSESEFAALSEKTELLTEDLASLQDDAMVKLNEILDARYARERGEMISHVATVALCLVLAIWIVMFVTRYLGSQVSKANSIFASMAQGKFDSVVGPQVGDELGVLLTSLDRMQTDLRTRLEAERVVAQANSRIRQSLDASSANVLVADETNKVIYANRAAESLMSSSAQDFRRVVSNFDASKLVGSSIETLHTDPAQQRSLLAGLTSTHAAELKFGSRTMKLVSSPIIDDTGKRLGTVVEWTDRTQELAVESEVQVIVSEALQGNLDKRIDMEGKAGFFKALSVGINELVANMATVVKEVQTIVAAANDGNLSGRVDLVNKSGLLIKIGTGINELTANMETVVNEVQALVTAANEGDLTKRVETEGKSGLLIKVGTGINQLAGNMSDIVSQVKGAAEEVSKGADEMSQGNTNLSQRTEEQASSLEETASSMEEMTSTVKQNADNAGQANQLAVAARDQAEKGGAVVAKAVRAMTDINDASKKIADIIGVIDEIAFQTNLLALNAAVEAARAGEQGRGFAVVATEVRNLASRSATAAKEIKTLIQDSVRKVDEGSSLVTQSGVTLEQIVAAVKRVTDIVAEISAASNEQSSGIDQVNKAVMQLDELTQQNAALVEEASAASQAMAEQARGLNESMQRYKVVGGSAREAVHAPAARPAVEMRTGAADRRKAGRPWNAGKAAPAKEAASAKLASTGTDDAVWKEF